MNTVRTTIEKLKTYPQGNVVCARIWTTHDVIERDADMNSGNSLLTVAEAEQVLINMDRNHDANIGINWDVIDIYTDEVIREREQFISELNRNDKGEIMFQDMWFLPPIRWVLSTEVPIGWEAYQNQEGEPRFLIRTNKLAFPNNIEINAARHEYTSPVNLKIGDKAILTTRVQYADGALFGEEGGLAVIVGVYPEHYNIDRLGDGYEHFSTISVFRSEVKPHTR